MRTTKLRNCGVVIAAAASMTLSAQTSSQQLAFEAASIKATAPDFRLPAGISVPLTLPANGGRMSSPAITAVGLMQHAFRTRSGASYRLDQIVGAPAWALRDRFEFVAASSPGTSGETFVDQAAAMLRTFLSDRFKLTTHIESRRFPVYALVVAHSDGRLGPSIHKSDIDCEAVRKADLERLKQATREDLLAQARARQQQLAATGQPPPPSARCSSVSGRESLIGLDISMTGVAGLLRVDRPVLDRTGLEGVYDVELHWAEMPTQTDPSAPPPASGGPSIFAALQEQLGLKLEPRTEPLDVLVIDHIEPPTPD